MASSKCIDDHDKDYKDDKDKEIENPSTSNVLNLFLTTNWDPTISERNEKEELAPILPKRIIRDFKDFFTDPVADIMFCPDSENLLTAHAIIVGPENTPYEGGFFYFYIKLPYNYPFAPPMVKLMTTGQNTVRFNPNLYSNGKVCLSLLNTWYGPQWNAATNLLSVLICIQAIMNDNPYLNEPGVEYVRCFNHTNSSKEYNAIILHETIRVAVIDMIEDNLDSRNMPSVLKEYVTEYFKTKISHYEKVIDANIHLDGKPMKDPFLEPRGRFQYKTLKLKMETLKKKYLSEEQTIFECKNSN